MYPGVGSCVTPLTDTVTVSIPWLLVTVQRTSWRAMYDVTFGASSVLRSARTIPVTPAGMNDFTAPDRPGLLSSCFPWAGWNVVRGQQQELNAQTCRTGWLPRSDSSTGSRDHVRHQDQGRTGGGGKTAGDPVRDAQPVQPVRRRAACRGQHDQPGWAAEPDLPGLAAHAELQRRRNPQRQRARSGNGGERHHRAHGRYRGHDLQRAAARREPAWAVHLGSDQHGRHHDPPCVLDHPGIQPWATGVLQCDPAARYGDAGRL